MRKEVAAQCEADLMYIFEESEVSLRHQWTLVTSGYKNIRRFVGLEESRAGVRTVLMADLGLDPVLVAEDRLQLSILLSAWETAKEQLSHEIQLRAEAKALRQVRPVSNQERISMRRLVEEKYGKLPACEVPAASYLSDKMEEVEQNDPHAAALDEVLSLEDGDEMTLGAGVDSSGKIHVVRKRQKIKMPATPEEFRRRLRVEGNLWIFLSTKFTNRTWLAGLTPEAFGRYTDHFLGKKVAELTIPQAGRSEDSGGYAVRPPWGVILTYEFECRKACFRLITDEGFTLKEALAMVVKDSEIKELYFTTPIALMPSHKRALAGGSEGSGRKRGRGQGGPMPPPAAARSGGGRGRGAKSAGKGGKNLLFRTPDQRLICFAFNNPSEKCDGSCGMVHVCRYKGCMGKHPMYECPKHQGGGAASAS